jgi:type I restriction enzyme M protein
LGTLFYRFISENLTKYINSSEEGIDFTLMKDEEITKSGKKECVVEKGFFIYPSQLFCNVVKKLNNNEFFEKLNENITKNLKEIEASAFGTRSEKNIKGLFDDYDVNSTRLGSTIHDRNTRLRKLFQAVNDLNFGEFSNNRIDLFGDAYEYLMNMYAANAGKSGGEFFTPQEVSELLAKIVIGDKKEINKVYDPCCGSGGLLLKFAKILGKDNVNKGFYGQELNHTTYNLSRINMFLHDINYGKFNIALGNTLLDPKHKSDEPFEAIVSNPPYSTN